MKQTAVEWLVEYFKTYVDMKKHIEEIEQAKEMEKQQIIDAFIKGFNRDYFSSNFQDQKEFSEQYYNETFKKK